MLRKGMPRKTFGNLKRGKNTCRALAVGIHQRRCLTRNQKVARGRNAVRTVLPTCGHVSVQSIGKTMWRLKLTSLVYIPHQYPRRPMGRGTRTMQTNKLEMY